MNLIEKYNVSALEDDMQEGVALFFKEYAFTRLKGYVWRDVRAKVFREVTIPGIGRRSDVIVEVTPRKVFNIECKVNDVTGVLKQAKDHLKWADYSYICLHSRTYIPIYQIKDMIDSGIGLLLWEEGALLDVLNATPNTLKNGIKQPALRKKMARILQKRTPDYN